MVLSIDEWSGKVDTRFRPTDWDLMAKVVSVLQVYNFNIVFGFTCPNFSVYLGNLYLVDKIKFISIINTIFVRILFN